MALRSFVLLTVAALVIAGAAGGVTADGLQRGSEGGIQELLDRRAAAVMAGDFDAFMATVADDSGAFVRRQRRLFERMTGVPLASYRLEARPDRFGDLATASVEKSYPEADAVSIPVTEERYRLEGFDTEEAIEDMFFTFVERDGEWLIA
jgi:hypothetical protein